MGFAKIAQPVRSPAGTMVLNHRAETQLGSAWFPDVNEWCRENLGPQCDNLQDPTGRWWTQLMHDDRVVDRQRSPFSIAIFTCTAEDHMLVSLRWC